MSHGFPDLDMVATDKTAYFESESGDDFPREPFISMALEFPVVCLKTFWLRIK